MMTLILILLAAGDSRRFDGNKLLHLIHGKMMYQYVADEVDQVKDLFAHRIVVTQYTDIMRDLESRGYHVIENSQSSLGISHSIHLALSHVKTMWKEETTTLCFAVCDQPYLKGETIAALVKGFGDSGKGIGCPESNGELGNPVIFKGHYMKELMELTGDVGGKRVVTRHMDDVYRFEVKDPKELVDIDVRTYAP